MIAKTPVDIGGGILENAFIQQKLKTMGGAGPAGAQPTEEHSSKAALALAPGSHK